MLKVNNRSTRCLSGVFITNLEYIGQVPLVCFLLTLNMLVADLILYCLNLNLMELDLGTCHILDRALCNNSQQFLAITYFLLQKAPS